MKRLILALLLCSVIVALIATPAMAAKSTLTFTTTLGGYGAISGTLEDGFTLITTGQPGQQTQIWLIDQTATPGLADGYYGFYLKANNSQKTTLTNYFANKKWSNPAWYTQINNEINGKAPFFYIVNDSDLLNEPYNYDCPIYMADGFMKDIYNVDTFLTIDDDYPVGTYVYKGQLKGSNKTTLMVTVTLTVVRGPS
jgi:hypothetical protein